MNRGVDMAENLAVKKMIKDTFVEIADSIEKGDFGRKTRVGLTILGSEHGTENLIKGAKLAASRLTDTEIVLIGPENNSNIETVAVDNEKEMHSKMEEILDDGFIDACVTMHYNFPIGVSTVGRVVVPGTGKEMIIASTTGTSSMNRTEAMTRNALHGIIAAKAIGIEEPTVGILNLDGARQVDRLLNELKAGGYDISLGESARADGGVVMRGNDLLCGSVDVMVTDTLTGNILMKMFSSYTTGGSYEASGYGYGPGVGEDYGRSILILSRASGIPVVANAIEYASCLARGGLGGIARDEFEKAEKAGLKELIKEGTKEKNETSVEFVEEPEKEIATGTLSGIDIMELEEAVKALWQAGIYAESGMGCTGPVVMVNEEKIKKAADVLIEKGYMAKESSPC